MDFRNKFHSIPEGMPNLMKIDQAIGDFLGTEVSLEAIHRYSTDISLAWRLWEKLRHMHFCCLEMDSDYCYTYGIKITEEYRPRWDGEYLNEEAAKNHEPSLWLDVADARMPALIAVAFVWANQLEVPGVTMPWERVHKEPVQREVRRRREGSEKPLTEFDIELRYKHTLTIAAFNRFDAEKRAYEVADALTVGSNIEEAPVRVVNVSKIESE